MGRGPLTATALPACRLPHRERLRIGCWEDRYMNDTRYHGMFCQHGVAVRIGLFRTLVLLRRSLSLFSCCSSRQLSDGNINSRRAGRKCSFSVPLAPFSYFWNSLKMLENIRLQSVGTLLGSKLLFALTKKCPRHHSRAGTLEEQKCKKYLHLFSSPSYHSNPNPPNHFSSSNTFNSKTLLTPPIRLAPSLCPNLAGVFPSINSPPRRGSKTHHPYRPAAAPLPA